jgi:integrase
MTNIRRNWFESSELPNYLANPDLAREQRRYTSYIEALKRIYARLEAKAIPKDPSAVRGRTKLNASTPQERSLSIKRYMAVFECFMLWNKAVNGRELLPHEITTAMCHQYCAWLASDNPPDVRLEKVREREPEVLRAWVAVNDFVQRKVRPDIRQVWLALNNHIGQPSQEQLEALHATMIRGCKLQILQRDPDNKVLISLGYRLGGYPIENFKWTVVPRHPVNTGTVALHARHMQAIWSEMLKGENIEGGQAPLQYNIWKEVTRVWEPKSKAVAMENTLKYQLARPVYDALEWAAYARAGSIDDVSKEDLPPTFEGKRDLLILVMLANLGLRVEELCGVLRKDLEVDGDSYVLTVYGKGDKVRKVRFGSVVRDAFLSMNAVIEYLANHGDERRRAYAQALLSQEAPVVPATQRWGFACRMGKKKQACDPTLPLGKLVISDVLKKLVAVARVRDKRTGETRELTPDEKMSVHPHAFRHFYATLSSDGGLHPVEIQKVLGHADFKTTSRYIDTVAASVGDVSLAMQRAREGKQLSDEDRAKMSAAVAPTIEAAMPVLSVKEEVEAEAQRIRETMSVTKEETWEFKKPAGVRAPPKVPRPWEEKPVGVIPDIPELPEQASPSSFEELRKADIVELSGIKESEPTRTVGPTDSSLWDNEKLNEFVAKGTFHAVIGLAIGNESHLPWWRGPNNAWTQGKAMPVLSRMQACPEDTLHGQVMSGLRLLHDQFDAVRGPTASAALRKWIDFSLSSVSGTFEAAMKHKGFTWAAFETMEIQDTEVREQLTDDILDWFEQFGDQVSSTAAGVLEMPGERKWQPPDWYFSPDPILELPQSERKELRAWFEKLQGLRPSKRNADVLATVVMMVQTYADTLTEKRFQAKTKEEKQRAQLVLDTYKTELEKLGLSALGFPIVPEQVLATQGEKGAHKKTIAYLKAKGLKFVEDVETEPVVESPNELFDPKHMRFTEDNTITYSEEYQRKYFERTGTSSECVARRVLRGMWEDRKAGKSTDKERVQTRNQAHLARFVPCNEQIEEALRKHGVDPRRFDENWKRAAFWADVVEFGSREDGNPASRLSAEDVTTIKAVYEEFEAQAQDVAALEIAVGGHVHSTRRAERMKANAEGMPHPVDLIFATHWRV